MRRREAGQGEGWGCGPEQLAATEPSAVYSGCMEMARRTQPLAVFCKYSGVLELYLNIIILYIDIYIISYILSWPKAVCASRRYYESETPASGSPTSLVLPLPHQSEVE
jgi:hypothetical protein